MRIGCNRRTGLACQDAESAVNAQHHVHKKRCPRCRPGDVESHGVIECCMDAASVLCDQIAVVSGDRRVGYAVHALSRKMKPAGRHGGSVAAVRKNGLPARWTYRDGGVAADANWHTQIGSEGYRIENLRSSRRRMIEKV